MYSTRFFPFATRAALAGLCAFGLGSALAVPLSAADEHAARLAVADTYKADQAACKTGPGGNARDICHATATSKEKVALAEIRFGQSGKPADAVKVHVARADGDFAVAKEKCDDLAGQPKSLCRTEAKAAHAKALADAKLATTVSDARSEARDDKMAANRKVAVAKCDALSGDAQASCMADVKARFDKS